MRKRTQSSPPTHQMRESWKTGSSAGDAAALSVVVVSLPVGRQFCLRVAPWTCFSARPSWLQSRVAANTGCPTGKLTRCLVVLWRTHSYVPCAQLNAWRYGPVTANEVTLVADQFTAYPRTGIRMRRQRVLVKKCS